MSFSILLYCTLYMQLLWNRYNFSKIMEHFETHAWGKYYKQGSINQTLLCLVLSCCTVHCVYNCSLKRYDFSQIVEHSETHAWGK